MKDNELIVCRDVSLGYEGKSVLTDLDLTIAKGDYLCVVGDNGSGKSTLMRGLLGLLQPQSGVIEHAQTLRHTPLSTRGNVSLFGCLGYELDLTELLPKIRQEVLLIWGDQDTATPIRDAHIMEEKIPNCGLAVIPGTGHFSFLEKPAQFRGIMEAYLK